MNIDQPILQKLKVGAVPVVRDENGYWDHPEIPWNLIPEDSSFAPYFKGWGYGWLGDELQFEDSELATQFRDSGEVELAQWEPKPPMGEGWFLASIYDTEDGPCALWLKNL